MAYEELITFSRVSGMANSNLSAKQFFAVDFVNDTSAVPTALGIDIATAGNSCLGILQDNPIQGQAGAVATSGITKAAISASNALTGGTTYLEVDTGGTLKAHASGTIVAKALETLASTAAVCIIAVQLLPSNATN
jgi:hypothetical protein